jgi:hypothetical protein
MTEHLRKVQESFYEGNFQNLLFHFCTDILDIVGFKSNPPKSGEKLNPLLQWIPLFQWKNTSLNELQNANLMHVISVMMGFLKSSLNSLHTKVKTQQSRESLYDAVAFMTQLDCNLSIVIPFIGVIAIVPNIELLKFVIQAKPYTSKVVKYQNPLSL